MDTTLPYAAGFLDGEGSVGVYRSHGARDRQRAPRSNRGHGYSADLQASGYVRGPLDLLQQAFGGQVTTHQTTQRLPVHHWRLRKQDAVEAALRQLIPHLIVKRAQAELTLWFLVWRRGVGVGHPFDPFETAEAEAFAEALKMAKQEGI